MISDPDPPGLSGRDEKLFYADEWIDYLLLIIAAGFFIALLVL